MNEPFQDVYAKHLRHFNYGYPLRMPEPMSTLPQPYQDDGLQIGDVGIVNHDGQFEVLFNVCKRSDHPLHRAHGVPKNFLPVQHVDPKFSRDAISPGPIHSCGIEQVLDSKKPRPVDYEFSSSGPAGAILILPHGATSHELSSPEPFRELAMKNALEWYEFARQRKGVLNRSLYLITGFYKTRSWSLGSFNNPSKPTGTILARRDVNNPHIYLLECSFPADRRHGCSGDAGGKTNQTVFITGFKIMVSSWLSDPMILGVTESEATLSVVLRFLKNFLGRLRFFWRGHEQHTTISVEHSPMLSQPFHPSDIINRLLLSKNPDAGIAITHDDQWMDMVKEGLGYEDLLQEDRLEMFLTQRCTISVCSGRENTTVFLQRKTGSVSPVVGSHSPLSEPETPSSPTELNLSPSTPRPEITPSPAAELDFSQSPTNPLDNPQVMIMHIRAQNIHTMLKRIPAGFYVLVQCSDSRRRTQNKSLASDDGIIQWEDKIPLPSCGVVRFMVYASFELEPMLGIGEVLFTSEGPVEELASGTHLITPGSTVRDSGIRTPDPSLLITLGQRYSDHLPLPPIDNDSNLHSEESSDLFRETNSGRKALLDYYNKYKREDLKIALQHFECAWLSCPPTHRCRAAALVNVAKARTISYQADPRSANLDETILLCRQALELRYHGPDRPATLLQLAQTLLLSYERERRDESIVDEINKLITELQELSGDSHERRAADLIRQSLKLIKIMRSGRSPELDGLILELSRSTKEPPDGHFDRPQRFINLGAALWSRYENHGEAGDLDQSFVINKQALQMLPDGHPDTLPILKTLGAVLWKRFKIYQDISYLRDLIRFSEEALKFTPEGHPERPYWVTNLTRYRADMLEWSGDAEFDAEEYVDAIAQYSQAITLLRSLMTPRL